VGTGWDGDEILNDVLSLQGGAGKITTGIGLGWVPVQLHVSSAYILAAPAVSGSKNSDMPS